MATRELGLSWSGNRPTAGDGLLRPMPLIAIALLVANDHVFKAAAPGLLTGKLSDFAGLAFFPLLIVALVEVVAGVLGYQLVGSRRLLAIAVIATGVIFAAIQVIPVAADAYRVGLGFTQWAVSAPLRLLSGSTLEPPWTTRLASDPSDLVALLILPLPLLDGLRRRREAYD